MHDERTLNKEDGNVVAHNVPITLLGVELDGEAAGIADGISAATRALDGREADKDRRLAAGVGEDFGGSVLGSRVVEYSEVAVRSGSAGVHDALWDALVVEPVDLFERSVICEL